MLSTHLGPSADLPTWAVWLACALAAISLGLLLVELRDRERGGWIIGGSGIVAVACLLVAVFRPARTTSRDTRVGARVIVLADASRSMALPGDEKRPRWEARDHAIQSLQSLNGRHGEHDGAGGARFVVLGFGEGPPAPLQAGAARGRRSDLGGALRALAEQSTERPAAVIVVSDGRLDDPPEDASESALKALHESLRVPIHAIGTTAEAPADASVRRVTAAGAAIAHVPLPLRVEVGCGGGLGCEDVTVTARELRDDGAPVVLASGVAHVKDGSASIDLTVTLERAGMRVVEVAIDAPPGDTIPENDRRLMTFDVTRERVRVLHVAGRPTNDVRALRQWLKSDASVDMVAFFILRTPTDDVHASKDDLALIPFPVDELFTEDLPTFDAIVLQDFDAQPYGLEKYLSNIERYVRGGGGLVMVGGQNSFVAGGYAGTPLADVLPVDLERSDSATSADTSAFVPEWTPDGRMAPLLGPLREIVGDDLPEMPGSNVLGDVRPGGIALWSHPRRTTRSGAPMPVLAVADEGEGRTIALAVDGAWKLKFSALGASTGGRGHGALWDGLLGWLMRDPRFETAQVELTGGCTAGLPAHLRARVAAAAHAAAPPRVSLELKRIDQAKPPVQVDGCGAEGASIDCVLPPLEAGAYAARLRVGGGTVVRHDFACEAGGDEWADSRPDPARLAALARASGGVFAKATDAASIPLPKPTVVSAERHVRPLAPAWCWSLLAAATLGLHWLARRRGGLA